METTVFIPANYTDAGKILGLFAVRNVVEAAVLGIPTSVLFLLLSPFGLTVNIIGIAVIVVPLCGFALLGINDYSLLTFLRLYRAWRKSRRILIYRGSICLRKTKKKK